MPPRGASQQLGESGVTPESALKDKGEFSEELRPFTKQGVGAGVRPETQAGAPCVLKLISTHEGRQEDLGFQALISWLGGSCIEKQKQQAFSSLSLTETRERGDGCAESLNTYSDGVWKGVCSRFRG